jgi:hypothetical protein
MSLNATFHGTDCDEDDAYELFISESNPPVSTTTITRTSNTTTTTTTFFSSRFVYILSVSQPLLPHLHLLPLLTILKLPPLLVHRV